MTSVDLIDRLPWEFAARLEADEYFSDIAIVVAEDGNVEQELKRAQAVLTQTSGKRGAAVIVLPMIADEEHPNIRFGPMSLHPAFQVIENLTLNRGINGTGKAARRIARRIIDVVKCAGMTGLVMDLHPERPAIEPVEIEGQPHIKALQVNFRCVEVVSDLPTQVELPTFGSATVGADPCWTLTCPTTGATIYYTTDDSFPRASNRTASVYSAAVVIPAGGVTVRACAYKAGSIASWINRAIITAT